ncbi:MAG: fimbrillin family protein [Prevotella sp.]|nr:fimbrillin family protein [Prevotella sp.]
MYKNFFMGIAAIAALTLVSCSSDDLNSLSDNSSKNEAISFDGYLGRSAVAVNGSRGSVLEIADLKKLKDGFGVFGNYNATGGQNFGSNLFNNEKVYYSSTKPAKWTYDNTKYWPTEGHIDFLAYAPYADKTTLNNKSIDFTVSSTIADQKDLLWANAVNQTKEKNSSPNKVKFQFAHALSRLGYTIKLNDNYTGTTITLNKITLAGSNNGTKKAFYSAGTIDLSYTPSTTSPTTTSLWIPSTSEEKLNFDWVPTNKTLSTTVTKNSDTEYLFVIPQDFSKTEENADALYVIVEYTIQTGTTATMTSRVSSQIKKNFEQGKAYMINLTIGLTPIEFEADVTTWKDGDKIDDITWN